jgi:hypothetical protein
LFSEPILPFLWRPLCLWFGISWDEEGISNK